MHAHHVFFAGACECSIACSTCHVILEDEVYDQLEEPEEDEDDMLDLAFGLTPTCVSLNDDDGNNINHKYHI